MPTKKPQSKSKPRDEDGKFVSEETAMPKAIVSELGVNDTPEPTEPKVVKTKKWSYNNIKLITYYDIITSTG